MQQFLWRTRASGRNVLEHRQSESVSLQISTLLPAAVAARLEDFILVILSSFLIDSHQFLPTDLPAENPLEVLRLPGQVSSLRAGQFLLLRLPFLPALGHVDPNGPRAEVSTTDVAGHECWWHGGCVGSQSVSQALLLPQLTGGREYTAQSLLKTIIIMISSLLSLLSISLLCLRTVSPPV